MPFYPNQGGEKPAADPKAGETPVNGNGNQPVEKKQAGETPANFDSWLNDQPEPIQNLIDQHLSGLKASLESERSEHKRLDKELKTMAKGMDQNNPLKPQLDKLSHELSEQTTRADFYEEAPKRGIVNVRLAFHAAKFDGLIDDRGRIDWNGLREKVPELFSPSHKPTAPPGNVGHGAGPGAVKQTLASSINASIRKAAGR
jgi:hypothetical protein